MILYQFRTIVRELEDLELLGGRERDNKEN